MNEMYNAMGDAISMQYGGSVAHKNSIEKKSKAAKLASGIGELFTSIKRHLANNFTDPHR
jgi:phosphatidylinositol 3,5-bisphosphate 5-phosphatase